MLYYPLLGVFCVLVLRAGGGEDVEAGEAGAGVEREGPRGGLLWTRRRSDGSKRAKRAHRKAATAAGWGGGGAAARGGQPDSG